MLICYHGYLSVLILEAVQKALQQLVGVVNSFRIFADDPDHGCPGNQTNILPQSSVPRDYFFT